MEKQSPTQEARNFIGGGHLRDILHGEISEEAIDKIIDACSFVMKF